MQSMDQAKAVKRAAEAAQPGQSAAEGSWTILSRPSSTEGRDSEEQLASMACSCMQYGDKVLSLSIKPSTDWTASDLKQLSTLVQSRNRFVCMQLVTMTKEQHDKVTAARSAGDATVLHTAQFMFLGTVALQDTGAVVAAALFYPRHCSKDGVEMPHMYVELLCCNSPGCGYGSVLLHHVEQYTAAGCEYISAGFFANEAAAGSTWASESVALVSSTDTCSTAVTPPAAAVLPVLASVAFADPLVGCCTACGGHTSSTISSSQSDHCNVLPASSEDILPPATLLPRAALAAAAAATGFETTRFLPAQQQQPVFLSTATTAVPPVAVAASTSQQSLKSCCKRLCGIKLLSIESAQAFYAHNGYGAPDVCHEMFKPLAARRAAAGSASTGSICSLMSVSSSSSNMLC